MSQCSSCGGFCKQSGCERADYVPPKQEPVAIIDGDVHRIYVRLLPDGLDLKPDTKLYTTPPQPEQEPVAHLSIQALLKMYDEEGGDWCAIARAVERHYTTTPQRTWVGLTDEEAAATAYKGFDEYWTEDCKGSETEAWAAAGRAIEAKLKEKNT